MKKILLFGTGLLLGVSVLLAGCMPTMEQYDPYAKCWFPSTGVATLSEVLETAEGEPPLEGFTLEFFPAEPFDETDPRYRDKIRGSYFVDNPEDGCNYDFRATVTMGGVTEELTMMNVHVLNTGVGVEEFRVMGTAFGIKYFFKANPLPKKGTFDFTNMQVYYYIEDDVNPNVRTKVDAYLINMQGVIQAASSDMVAIESVK